MQILAILRIFIIQFLKENSPEFAAYGNQDYSLLTPYFEALDIISTKVKSKTKLNKMYGRAKIPKMRAKKSKPTINRRHTRLVKIAICKKVHGGIERF